MGDSKNWSNFAAKQAQTMEQKFGKNSIDIEALREFCEREGKEMTYRKGDQLEREGDPARWFGFVTEGCFKYVTYGISDDKAPIKREPSSSLGMAEREEARPKVKEHITWFSFEGEFAGILTCRTSPRSLTSILTPSARYAARSHSTPKNNGGSVLFLIRGGYNAGIKKDKILWCFAHLFVTLQRNNRLNNRKR